MKFRGLKMLMVLAFVAVCITGCPPNILTPAVVTVTPVTATLAATQSLLLTASSTDAADAPFTWTNSNPAVATIDGTTGSSVTVTAVAPGITSITVKGSNSGSVATSTIVVPTTPGEPEVITVGVTPSNAVLETGQVLPLSATSTNPADTFTWTQRDVKSLDLSATTGASINVTALTPGVTIITVTGSVTGATATATISVLSAGGEIGTTPLVPAGLNINITDVTIPGDNRPVVIFTALNNRGDVVPQVELTSIRFIIAHLVAPAVGNLAQYASYISNTVASAADPNVTATQATYDSAGAAGTTDNGDGTYTYKFKKALPAGFDPSETHAVGAQFNRLSALDGVSYPANATIEFRPDGAAVTATRDIVDTATCNDCHTRLGLHGGGRREVRLCILCHNAGTVDPDTGNTVDLPVLVHKIHMGDQLPSVVAGTPYQIIGHGGSVADYSTVAFPQEIKNCVACHRDNSTKGGGSQAGVWKTSPNRKACGSCHDRTWFGDPSATPAGFENHPLGFNQADDSMCAVCHPAQGAGVAPIVESHHTVAQLPENAGLDLQITAVTPNATDGTLTITFHAADLAGNAITDITTVSRVGANVGWPASEYANNANETIVRAGAASTGTLVNTTSPTGDYQYIFLAKLPLDPGVTFGIVMTGRVQFTHTYGDDPTPTTVQQGLKSNSLQFFTVDGSEPQARRDVVDDAQCAKCHGGTIRAHGGSRVGVGTCVMCHRPNAGDIHLKYMLHHFHTGAELARPFSIGSFVANDIRFPGLRNECSICHAKNSVDMPLAPEAAATLITNPDKSVTTILPIRSTCTSCHDDLMVDVHAVAQTDSNQAIESCPICHDPDGEFAVGKMHALAP